MEKILTQLSSIFESWEGGVLLETLDGVIISCNKNAQNLYGYSAEEIIGKEYSILIPPDIKENYLDILNKISRRECVSSYKTVHKRKDNSRVHVSLTISPVTNESDKVIAAIVLARNISEREQEHELFTALTQSSPIGIYIVQDGKLQFTSRQFDNIMGYTSDEMINTESSGYIHPDDKDLVNTNAIRALKNGQCQPYEYRIITKSGQLKWILETVISIHYRGKRAALGNLMDITESKRLQEERQQANEKLTFMVKRLEEQNRQNGILAEMRDMLQACSKMEETSPIIMGAMKKLFPEAKGALFLLSNSRSDLESVATWGDFPLDTDENIFAPEACWGLRRGRAHVVENIADSPICPHLKHTPSTSYVCLPLMAKGDILGLLHLQSGVSTKTIEKQKEISDLKEIASALSEYLSLAIANVKLGESLAKQSIQDPLSGLYNRRFMEESLQREILRAKRKQMQIGIIMADLDHFKDFNDIHGHAAGDKIINQVGKLFKEKTRGSDIACRYGGEEFVIILPDCSSEDAFRRADELREEVKKIEIVFQGQILGSINISMGIASYPVQGIEADELLRAADAALYRAKQAGRDRVIGN
jgi:diguanylate cyclase (GGDEF)-like protein/PAS domain S-box-containing protein